MSRKWETRDDGTLYAVNVRPSRQTKARKEKHANVMALRAERRDARIEQERRDARG